MARNIIQDMVPSERRSIRQIEVSPLRRPRETGSGSPTPPSSPPPPPPPPSSLPRFTEEPKPSSRRGIGIWVIAGIAVVALGFALSLFFTSTAVAITPKQSNPTIDTPFKAYKTPLAGELAFQTMSLDKTGSLAVPSNGEEEANVRASGQIIVYNDYSTAVQRLIRNTRFQSTTGKIYRIDKSVVVPGKSGSTPGSIEVTVYADEPGDSYNADLTDFTVPGFKGSPQYDKFYARSKTPMTGGFVGKRLTVDPVALEKAKNDIHEQIKTDLIGQAQAQKPEGFELYEGAVFFDFTSLQNTETAGTVQIHEKGVLHAVLFAKSDLAAAIAVSSSASPAEGTTLTLGDESSLIFTIGSADTYQPWEKESFSFTLEGAAHLIALFDEGQLRIDLAGKSKKALPTVLAGYPGIERAEVVMRPFWRNTFPTDPSKIKLSTILGTK